MLGGRPPSMAMAAIPASVDFSKRLVQALMLFSPAERRAC